MKNRLPLILILILGFVFRVVNLRTVPGWWPDEGVMLNIATNLLHGKLQMFAFTYPMNPHPPIFFITAIPFIKILGANILAVRSVGAITGSVSIILVYIIAKELGGKVTGTMAALLAATFPTILLTSRIGLSYELLSMLFLLNLTLLIFWSKNKNLNYLIMASIIAGLCSVTSYVGIAAIVFTLTFVCLNDWRKLIHAAIYCVLPFLLYLTIFICIDKQAFVHDILYLFTRPESSNGSKQLVESYKKLFLASPFMISMAIGFFLSKNRLGVLTLLYILIISLLEFTTRGYWWCMLSFMPLVVIGPAVTLGFLIEQQKYWRVAAVLIFVMIFGIFTFDSYKKIFIDKTFHLVEEKIFAPKSQEKLEFAVNYINQNTNATDMVISSPHISWMIHAKPTDPILSYVSHDRATTNFPDDMNSTGRFVYNPDYNNAKYYLEDNFMTNWFDHQPFIKESVLDPIRNSWIMVMDNGEFKVYENPKH